MTMRKFYEPNEKENTGSYLHNIDDKTQNDILSTLANDLPGNKSALDNSIEIPDVTKMGGAIQNGNDLKPTNSLGVVETEFDKRTTANKTNMEIAMEVGYRALGIEMLPSKGKYYPADCMVSIRPADVSEIKHFSTMNEEDYIDAEDKILFVLNKCCKLVWGGVVRSSDYLKDADKLYLLFTIRDLTMSAQGKENKIMMEPQCPDCGVRHKKELVNNIFGYYDIPAGIAKWYSEEERCFVVHLESEILKVYVPSVGVTSWMKKFIVEKERRKRANADDSYYDKTALQYAQYLIASPTGATEGLIKKIAKQMGEEWSLEKTEAMQYLSEKLTYAVKPTITILCKNEEGVGCGKEFSAPITFRQGLRYLFNVTSVATKLFGDS